MFLVSLERQTYGFSFIRQATGDEKVLNVAKKVVLTLIEKLPYTDSLLWIIHKKEMTGKLLILITFVIITLASKVE